MKLIISVAFLLLFSIINFSQINTNTLVKIVRAEDERRWDSTLENLLTDTNPKVRERTVLAIGRIGREESLPSLANLLSNEKDESVRAIILFAVGEIESAKGSSLILRSLSSRRNSSEETTRAIEAAGKIAAANAKDENSKKLGLAILDRLNFENSRRSKPDENVILACLTAVLRARPEGGEKLVAEFLDYSNSRIRADALNTLARLRAKSVNAKSRELLVKDTDPIVRANAARMLGVGEDKDAFAILLDAARKDQDSRVRVSAIRSLGSLKNESASNDLISHGELLLRTFSSNKSEILEIASVLGRLLPNTESETARLFLEKIRQSDKYQSGETEIALALVSPKSYLDSPPKIDIAEADTWRQVAAVSQGFAQYAKLADKGVSLNKNETPESVLASLMRLPEGSALRSEKAFPDLLGAYSQFKPKDLDEVSRKLLKQNDVHIRAAAAGIIADLPATKESLEALKTAFNNAYLRDKIENDAQLAILDSLFKLDKKEALPSIILAANSKDYLVRKKAFELLNDESYKDADLAKITLEKFLAMKKNRVFPYTSGSKLGQVLNKNADYVRAVSRKNGTVKAVFKTAKGNFVIDLTPEDAPLTVDNFIKLARANYFNGLAVHRVVANFVMQDGDPRGDGNGGPGWSIRCEVNTLPYGRGAVGMALSGKDTGGSQWFATHSPQPHLDGGYTVFGKISEMDMKIVDQIARGDVILKVTIIEKTSAHRKTK